ncbi:MAG TPA: hypothetical protein PLS06_06090, partial [Proteiniphilum sp.]|nr:hypothetical protein [Proteiniphilum sp.]
KASVPQKGTGGSNPPLSAKCRNASPDVSGLVSVLWNATSMLACEEQDIKQKYAPQVQAFLHFEGLPKGITIPQSGRVIPAQVQAFPHFGGSPTGDHKRSA